MVATHVYMYMNVCIITTTYRIAGKFGRELNLVVWQSAQATAKLKSAKISYSHIYVWRSRTELPNLNPPIRLQWQYGSQPPNLIPANIFGYMVYIFYCKLEFSKLKLT